MRRAHWKLVLVDHLLGTALVNAAINGAIAWLVFGTKLGVPLWGLDGMALDLVATGLLLPFLYCVIATPLLRRGLREGMIPPLAPGSRAPVFIRWLPETARRRGVALGIVVTVTVVPATIAWLASRAIGGTIAGTQFVAFKSLWAAGLAALVGPIIARSALAERPASAPIAAA